MDDGSDGDVRSRGDAPQPRRNLCVYVVESTSQEDREIGRREGGILCELLKLSGTACQLWSVDDRTQLGIALLGIAADVYRSETLPIIHISAHGNNDGVALFDRTSVSWGALRDSLVVVNRSVGGWLLLGMSSCFGAAASRMAMVPDGGAPFYAVIGHQAKPSWADTAVGFAAAYHRLSQGATPDEALLAMRTAAGNEGFLLIHAERALSSWLETISKEPPEFREELVRSALVVSLGAARF